nr:hypothetical protein [uncultured bacterium]
MMNIIRPLVLLFTVLICQAAFAGDIVNSVIKAPVVSDGTTAGHATDIVINLDTTLDPSTNGRTLLQGKTIRITLPASFQNTKDYMFGGCGPPLFDKPCNTAVLLQGWPQHPVGPPPEKYAFDYEEATNTLVFTAKVDLEPDAPLNPGIKQMHLLLFGFTNPHPGHYRLKVEAETGPGGALETGWAKIHIIPKSRPSINVTSTSAEDNPDNPMTRNTIYQSATVGTAVPLNYNFLLWDRKDKAFLGVDIVDIDGNGNYLFKKDNKVVGHVSIDGPEGAVGQMLMSFGESVQESPPTIGGPETTARWVGKFYAGSEPGRYTVTAKLNGGNEVEMFVDVTK